MRRRQPALVLAGLLALCACGGGGETQDDLSGAWALTLYEAGIPQDPYHLTVSQAGSDVSAVFTCNTEFPTGVGTWAGGVFHIVFDLGGGEQVELLGVASGGWIQGSYALPGGNGEFTLVRTSTQLDCAHACDPVTPPRFVDTDFTDLGLIQEISLFRSSAGHDYSDACEPCRSMKHYFSPLEASRVNGTIPVRAPVAGQITSIRAEMHGASVGLENKQVQLRSSMHPEVTFTFFHVDLAAGVEVGDTMAAGEALGTARLEYPDLGEVAHDFDLAVSRHTLYGPRYVSWFEVITDALFETYAARGATSRGDLILTQAARDGDPLTCDGETFTSSGVLPSWFVLDPP